MVTCANGFDPPPRAQLGQRTEGKRRRAPTPRARTGCQQVPHCTPRSAAGSGAWHHPPRLPLRRPPSREGGGRRCQCEAVAGFHLFRWWDARCTSPTSSSQTTWGLHLARCCSDFRPASASARPGSSRRGLHLASLLPTTGHNVGCPCPCWTPPLQRGRAASGIGWEGWPPTAGEQQGLHAPTCHESH